MPVDVVTVGFCPQYFSTWRVPGSRHGVTYEVTLNGAEHAPHCTCPDFRWRGAETGTCKHVERVWKHGCLWNPQWRDPGPNDYAELGIELVRAEEDHRRPGDPCRGCGEPTVAVKIAV